MKSRITLVGTLLAFLSAMPAVARADTAVDNTYATRMIDFLPAPGQFVGTNFAQPHTTYCVGANGTVASLGGFGGYVILEFAQPIVNDPHNPYGVDFTIHGNSFAANIQGVWTEPGAVMVMKDENHNGLPDDTWYELAGSDYYLSTTRKNVSMTYYNPYYNGRHTMFYRCDDGTTGAMRTNQFHQQSYFPGDYAFESPNNHYDSITYTGNLIKGCIDLSTPSYIENYRAQLFGYCDNKGAIKDEVHNPYTTTMAKGGDGFDLDWAVDKDGNYVALDTVKWVKVYTSLNQDGGWLGELSTEVNWAQRVTPDPTYTHRNYYAHYIGIPQLKAVVGQPVQYEGLLFRNGRPCNEGTPQWSLSNDSCGTIDQTGKFTPTHGGQVYVHFTQLTACGANDTIVVARDSVRLRVVELTGVVLEMEGNASMASNDSTSLYVGEYTYITAQSVDNISEYINSLKANRYTYDTYTWTTSNPEIGTVQNGLFHADKAGRTMLYAYSNTNPALYDSILVIVKEPAVSLKNNPVVLDYKTPEAEYALSDLFDADGATIQLKSCTNKGTKAQVEWNAADKTFSIAFTKDDFGTDTVEFVLTALKQEFTLLQPFCYYQGDILPQNKRLFFVNGGVFGGTQSTELLAYDTESQQTSSVGTLNATSVQDLVIDGAYAYVAADNYIARFNTSTGEQVALRYCQDITQWDDGQGKSGYGLNNKMVVYKNWLLVTRQNSSYAPEDGYNVRVYNKTDLSLARKIAVSDQATDIAVVGTKAYVLVNGGYAGTTSSMAIIDLTTLTLTEEVALGKAGLNVSQLLPKDNLIYAIRRDNYSVQSAVLAFNTKTNTFTETATNLPSSFLSAPAAIDPMTGDSILLATETAFVTYNTRTGVTATESLMATPATGLSPMGSTRDAGTGLYYVAYGAWSGAGEGRIYNADFSVAGSFTGVGASPEAMAMGDELERNNAPQRKSTLVTQTIGINEFATSSYSKTITKTSFSDTENNIDNVYLKNWARYADWLTPELSYANGAKFSCKFPAALVGKLGEDSVVHVYAEAIDSWGASVEYEAYTITFRPAVYTIYAHPMEDVMVAKNADDKVLSLKDVFTWKKPANSYVTFAKSVKANTNPDLVTATINGDDLTLSFAEDKVGTADLTLLQTGRYKNADPYMKSAETTLHVVVSEETTSLDEAEGNSLVVYPNPVVDHLQVYLAEAGTICVYDLTGQCIAEVVGQAGTNTIVTTAWTNGVYIVQCNDLTAKVVK